MCLFRPPFLGLLRDCPLTLSSEFKVPLPKRPPCVPLLLTQEIRTQILLVDSQMEPRLAHVEERLLYRPVGFEPGTQAYLSADAPHPPPFCSLIPGQQSCCHYRPSASIDDASPGTNGHLSL
jgi:hypothetical protein